MNLLEGRLDLVLHLMDRQVIAEDGALVCKVDDLEVTEDGEGALVVTALLAGPAALVPRLGRKAGRGLQRAWADLVIARADGNQPYRIDLSLVDRVDSAVHLTVARDQVLSRQEAQPSDEPTRRHRLNDLLGAQVMTPAGRDRGRVTDTRAERRDGQLMITELIIGRDRPGGLLGYDRKRQGPALIRAIVRALHRDSGLVGLPRVRSVDWVKRIVQLDGEPGPLNSALGP
jgi:sporulation protein YlmC with PRC-barrel domain